MIDQAHAALTIAAFLILILGFAIGDQAEYDERQEHQSLE